MKRLVIFVTLMFLIAACNVLPPATITPQPRATNTLRIPDDVPTPSTCGNKVCDPPWENPWTCPDDCPKPTSAPSAIPPSKPPLTPTSGEGPYFHQVHSASSRDGLTWTYDNRLLLDHASVPAAIVTPEGKIRIYYVDASGAREGRSENVNCAESSDGGATFRVLNCTIANRAGDKAVDPSIVRLPDGRYRLYYYAVTGKMDATSAHAIYSAISTDGVHFTQEKKVFEHPGVVDPDVFWTGKEWLMYVFASRENETIIARSSDGLSFEYVAPLNPRNWGTTAPVKLDDGRFRLYAFKQPEMNRVGSFISTDALNWTQESGVRLTARSGESITDPFVVRLPDGTWKMFFKVQRSSTAGSTAQPPGTPGTRPTLTTSERPCLPEKRTIAIPDPEGPSYHQVLLAKSADGSTWQTDNRVIIDQASVPEGLRLSDGRRLIYAVDGSGLGGPGLVYAESKDEGKTWTCGKINLQGADPDVIVLPDGRIRLYYVEFPPDPKPPVPGLAQANQPNRVKSAISSDGKNFTVEEGVRLEGIQYTDPDVIRVGNDWFMYVSTGMTAWAAQSSDGLTFKLVGKVNETGAVSGSYAFPDGTLRHYFCGRDGILSATSSNGASVWKPEPGTRIALNPNWKIVCDPSVASDGKGGYWMVYKIQPAQTTGGAPQPTQPASTLAPDLVFIPDAGVRVENATNPAASVSAAGVYYLFFEQRSGEGPGKQMVATSSDGLNFAAGRQPTSQDDPYHPFHLRLPDGTWRKYIYDPRAGEMRSESSRDGIHYTPDAGARYKPHANDKGTIGVTNYYVDSAGGVVLLYVGDMTGVNNVRRAYSKPGDNGWTFVFEDDNVLGDKNAGGGGNSYVDPKSILLPDGRRRLFVMSQGAGPKPPLGRCGTISSFVSRDGKTYTLEPGTRLTYNDFTEFQVSSLNDPVVIRLPDGRYRMYVAALIVDRDGKSRWAIVSATTR